MHFAAASSHAAHRRIARDGADMRAPALAALAALQDVVVLPPPSPGLGRP